MSCHCHSKLTNNRGFTLVELSIVVVIVGLLIGGILIMIGLFAGIAAFISSGLMAFAYFMAHFSIQTFLPIQNRGELAVLYCFVLLYIAAVGSGTWSLDSLLNRSKKSRAK